MDLEDKELKNVGVLGVIVTTLVGLVSSFLKGRTDKRIKELEVSTGWQAQMLERIQHLEVRLEKNQEHLDNVEWNERLYREKVKELQVRIQQVRENEKTTEFELLQARQKIVILEKQKEELETELQKLRGVRGDG